MRWKTRGLRGVRAEAARGARTRRGFSSCAPSSPSSSLPLSSRPRVAIIAIIARAGVPLRAACAAWRRSVDHRHCHPYCRANGRVAGRDRCRYRPNCRRGSADVRPCIVGSPAIIVAIVALTFGARFVLARLVVGETRDDNDRRIAGNIPPAPGRRDAARPAPASCIYPASAVHCRARGCRCDWPGLPPPDPPLCWRLLFRPRPRRLLLELRLL